MTRKKTWLCLGAALLILAGTAAGGYFWYRDRQSQPVTVTADQAQELPAESVVYFRQKDDRWRADALGDSRYHMADSGCLVCCVASALQMQHLSVEGLPADADAGQVNEFFSAHGIYDSEGNLQWEVLEQVTGLTAEERDAAALDECLQNGDDPIVLVKMPKSGSFGGQFGRRVPVHGSAAAGGADRSALLLRQPDLRDAGLTCVSAGSQKEKEVRSKHVSAILGAAGLQILSR